MYYDNAVTAMQAALAYAIPIWAGYTEDCGRQKTDGNQSGPIEKGNKREPNRKMKADRMTTLRWGQSISLRIG